MSKQQSRKAAAVTAVVYVGDEESVQLSPFGGYLGGDVVAQGETFKTTAEHAAGLLLSPHWQPGSAATNEGGKA